MRIKKILACLVVILLVVKSPLIAYAESAPGTVSVSGGSIGSGGVEGNSNVLKGTALTVIMATLASAGVQIKLALEDYEHGNSALNYLEDKFAEWESTSGQAWDNYNNYRALNETKIDSQGNLYVPEVASAIMQKFVNWLYANEDIQNLPQVESPDTVNGAYYGSVVAFRDNAGRAREYVSTLNGNTNFAGAKAEPFSVAWVQVKESGNYNMYAYYPDQDFYVYLTDGSKLKTYGQIGRYHYMIYGLFDKLGSPFPGVPIVNNIVQYLQGLNGAWEIPEGTPVINNTGFYSDNADIPQLVDESGNGKILKVNPGLIGQIQDSYVGSNNSTIGLQDYLDALSDLYGQQAIPQEVVDLPDITIPGEDAITGTKEDVAVIDREIALSPDITVPADPDSITWPEVPETAIAVADPSVPADPEVSIPAMSIDLTQYFPFCLPFDIYHILQKLNADPVTPEVTVDWGNILGVFGIDYVMQLDLHDYDNLAELLRNMETAAFVVGLAVVTRQMFLRG